MTQALTGIAAAEDDRTHDRPNPAVLAVGVVSWTWVAVRAVLSLV